MKRVRIALSLASLLLATAGVFASQLIVSEPGFRVNPSTGVCDQIMICSGSGPNCVSNGNLFRKEANGTCATNILQHTP